MTEQHAHPGGDVPHRHSENDELAVHDTGTGTGTGTGKVIPFPA